MMKSVTKQLVFLLTTFPAETIIVLYSDISVYVSTVRIGRLAARSNDRAVLFRRWTEVGRSPDI